MDLKLLMKFQGTPVQYSTVQYSTLVQMT